VVAPIDDFVKTADDRAWMNTFYPAFMENARLKGKTVRHSLPALDPRAVLEQGCLQGRRSQPRRGPATWAEMRDMAKKLTKKDASGATTQWGIRIPSDGNTAWLFTGITRCRRPSDQRRWQQGRL
jgi:sn-glycerol 3-phosphate transport system substrate-binding protein